VPVTALPPGLESPLAHREAMRPSRAWNKCTERAHRLPVWGLSVGLRRRRGRRCRYVGW